MKLRLKRIAPLQAAKMLAGIYALFAIIIIPIMIIVSFSGAHLPLAMAIGLPLLYIIVGFVGGLIGAAIYNIVAGWFGGFEIEFEQ